MSNCELCGDPMPAGEEVFKFHGFSGPCPKPPMDKGPSPAMLLSIDAKNEAAMLLTLCEPGTTTLLSNATLDRVIDILQRVAKAPTFEDGYRKGATDCAGISDRMDNLEARHDALRADVMTVASDPHLEWDEARTMLMAALSKAAPHA